jgi:hypothetical protein
MVERYVTCGNPSCKRARGERHGPMWYLTVTLGTGRTTGGIISTDQVEPVRRWMEKSSAGAKARHRRHGLAWISHRPCTGTSPDVASAGVRMT